jgi:RHS repeat-associated protein
LLGNAFGSVRQVANEIGAVNLVQSYSPYGEVISSVGDYETAFSYTSEMTDGTGLVFLRARYYDPGTGRFVNKDTWGGDYNNPITLAKWLYTNGNPIIFTDPNGNRPTDPECGYQGQDCPSDSIIPDIENYDPAIEPRGISWNPNVTVPLSLSIDINTKDSQLNPEVSLEEEKDMGGNLCGSISLTMIAQANCECGDTLFEIWSVGLNRNKEAVNVNSLLLAAIRTFSGNWIGKSYIGGYSRTMMSSEYRDNPSTIIWHDKSEYWAGATGSNAYSGLYEKLNMHHYLIALVQSKVTNGWNQVSPGGGVNHYVVITGLSSNWQSYEKSPLNWVRVNNPYNNREEYYPWKDFKPAFKELGFGMVELWKK